MAASESQFPENEKKNMETDRKTSGSKKSAETVALSYISYRDRSRLELRQHLEKKEYSPEEIEVCLKNLEEWGLLDDENFCRKYIRYSKEKQRGPVRIRADLREKGLDGQIIEACMDEEYSREEELAAARDLAERMLANEKEKPLDERMAGRIARCLISRGFSGHVVFTVLGMLKSS